MKNCSSAGLSEPLPRYNKHKPSLVRWRLQMFANSGSQGSLNCYFMGVVPNTTSDWGHYAQQGLVHVVYLDKLVLYLKDQIV